MTGAVQIAALTAGVPGWVDWLLWDLALETAGILFNMSVLGAVTLGRCLFFWSFSVRVVLEGTELRELSE